MLSSELENIVSRIRTLGCELQHVELKAASNGTPRRLYDTFSSFANQENGGLIIFGIDEEDDYAVCGVYDPQDLQAKVTEQANQMIPPVRPAFTIAEISSRIIVSAEIPECDAFDKPCYYSGAGRLRGSYIRVGGADMPMTEYEVYSYEAFRRNIQDELRIVERADYASFDRYALSGYFSSIRAAKPNLSQLTENKILQLQGLVDNDKPTMAGLMLFGEYPQAFFPQLSVTAVVIDGTKLGDYGNAGERFIDNQRIEGTIPQMLEGAIAFIRRNTRTATIVDKDGRRADRSEYPIIAIREIILNALTHRDYSMHTSQSPIRIMIFSDRIEVENPGGLYGRMTVDELGRTAADTRNPFIVGALEVMRITENRFSGIPTIMAEMSKAGLPPAAFESRRGVFKAILYNGKAPAYKDDAEGLVDYCSTPRSREEIAMFLGMKTPSYAVRRYVNPLLKAGTLRMLLPDTPKSKNQRYVSGSRYREP